MSTFDHKPLVEAAKKATQGDWRVHSDPSHYHTLSDIYSDGVCVAQTTSAYPQIEDDAVFIAHANPPTVIAWGAHTDALTRALAERDAEIARLRGAVWMVGNLDTAEDKAAWWATFGALWQEIAQDRNVQSYADQEAARAAIQEPRA